MDHKHLSTDYTSDSVFEHYRWKGRYVKYQLLILLSLPTMQMGKGMLGLFQLRTILVQS